MYAINNLEQTFFYLRLSFPLKHAKIPLSKEILNMPGYGAYDADIFEGFDLTPEKADSYYVKATEKI